METLFIYLLKSSGLIAIFYLAYHFLVRKETFFTSNRWFLITGLFTSLLLPLFSITKVVYVERPKIALEDLVVHRNVTATTQAIPVAETIDWMLMLGLLYGIVSCVLFLKIIVDLISLYRIIKNQQVIAIGNFKLVNLNKNISPFSFFNYIVYNPNLYTQDELNSILLHEKIHSQEKHSIDIIVAKLFCVVFWCNPFVWLYKKAITQNLEYIADHKAINQLEDKKSYQKALLKIVSTPDCLSVTNNFYQSLIKKRIVMLNKNQSQQRNSWKYTLVIPALIGFIFLFQIKVEAQAVEIKKDNGEVIIAEKIKGGLPIEGSYVFDKISSDSELKNDVVAINAKYDINFKIYNIKRNAKGEIIAIKMSYNDKKGNKGKTEQARDIPIRPIFLKISTDDNGKNTIGFYDNHEMIVKPKDPINEKKITTIESIKDDAVIFVDGERYTKEDLNYLDPKGLEKIEILNDVKSLEKYGVKDKNEVIIITTNWTTKTNETKSETPKNSFSGSFSILGPEENISDIKENKSVDYKKALIIYDDKEISWKQLDDIDSTKISTMTVITTTKNLMDKYGDKAKNGVIEIQSQEYFKKNDPTAKFIQIDEKIKSNENLEKKKELELKAQENSKLTKSEMEERMKDRNKKIEKRNKMLEERKKKMEERKKEL
jgi:hypothetical protein